MKGKDNTPSIEDNTITLVPVTMYCHEGTTRHLEGIYPVLSNKKPKGYEGYLAASEEPDGIEWYLPVLGYCPHKAMLESGTNPFSTDTALYKGSGCN